MPFSKKIIFLISCTIIVGSCYGQNYFEEGGKAYDDKEYANAINLFTISIAHKQEIARSYMDRGMAKVYSNDFFQGIKDLDSSRTLDTLNPNLYYNYGLSYLLYGFSGQAKKYFDKALQMKPDDPDIYDNLAVIAFKNDDFAEAIRLENIAVKLDSTDLDYYTNRGFAKASLKQYKEAVKDYNKSMAIAPDAHTLANRADAYFQLGKYKEAISDLNQALTDFPKSKDLIYERGLAYQALGDKDAACADFEKSAGMGCVPAITAQAKYCN